MTKWLIIVGGGLIAIFNPLSVNLWADFLEVAIRVISTGLVEISHYTLIVGGTLLGVGLVSAYIDSKNRTTKKYKKLKSKKSKTPAFLE